MTEERLAEIKKEIEKILEERINPQLGLHNGGATFSGFYDGVVAIKFWGACASCMASSETVENIVYANLKEIPEVKSVEVDESVGDDLLEMARKILRGELKD